MASETVKLILEMENKAKKEFKATQKQIKKTEKSVDGLNSELVKNKKNLNSSAKSAKKASKEFTKLNKSTKGIAKNMKSIATVGSAVAAGLALIASNSLETNKEMTALSNIAGVSVGELKKLEIAYGSFGVSADDLSSTMKDLTERLNDATLNNAGEFVDIAKSMGLELSELEKLAPDELMERMNTELSKLSESQRISFADRLGSDAYVKIAQAAKAAGAEIAEMKRRTEELNIGLNSSDTKKLTAISKEFSLLGGNVETFTGEILASFSSEIINLVKDLNDVISQFRKGESKLSRKDNFDTGASLADAFGNDNDVSFSIAFPDDISAINDVIAKAKKSGDEQLVSRLELIKVLNDEKATRMEIFKIQQTLSKEDRDNVELQKIVGQSYINVIDREKKISEEKRKQTGEYKKQAAEEKRLSELKEVNVGLSLKLSEAFKNVDATTAKLQGNFEGELAAKLAAETKILEKELKALDIEIKKILSNESLYNEKDIKLIKQYEEASGKLTKQLALQAEANKLAILEREGQRLQTGLNAGVEGFTQEKVDNNLEQQLTATKKLYKENSIEALTLLGIQKQMAEQASMDALEGFQETEDEAGLMFGLGQLTEEEYITTLTDNLALIKEKIGETSLGFLTAQDRLETLKTGFDTLGTLGAELAESLAQGIGKSFTDMLKGAESFEDGLKSVFSGIAEQLAQAIIQALIYAAIMAAIGGGGTFSQNFQSNLSGKAIPKAKVPVKHNGGEVGAAGDSRNSTKKINMLNPSSQLNPNERMIIALTDETVVKTSDLKSPTGVGNTSTTQPQVSVNNYVTDDVLITFLENDRSTEAIINIINRNSDHIIR